MPWSDASVGVTDTSEMITHMGTSTKMKIAFMRRKTDAPGAEKNWHHHIISNGQFRSPDIPDDFAAAMFHDANTRMRTCKYMRSASNT